ncbi:MBL fold metallo-hydrolase [Alginatibacterium sediminis]|uniref:MBL fold metallo-hydrolase n=1 Tax=Alginatibacterium sediminis TaxID=2164068 RepID=A0A420E823_9ALTE|nr:MBL fold metallo-hydrolase [Alginatibacterium sediminis]RKF15679.1 MBL fold metallo-hydrolase [Alginatibacterium sediminis]
MKIESFFDDATNTLSYIVIDPVTQAALVIDPVMDYDPASGRTDDASVQKIIGFIKAKQLKLELIIETHVHADHLSGAQYLKQQLGGKIAIGEHVSQVQEVFGQLFNAPESFATDGSQFDILVSDGQKITFGALSLSAIHTPGHTPACMSYLIEDALFVGDTLFMPDFGTARADFPGGDAGQLYDSIQKLLRLPNETLVYTGHDYKAPGRDNYAWQSTIGEQKNNIHLVDGVAKEEFVRFRQQRDASLAVPRLLLPSVQVNMNAGKLPEAETNGQQFLKIPLNAL